MYYIGVDLGGTNIAVGLVTREGSIVNKRSVPTGADRPFEEIFADMGKCTLALLDENGILADEVDCVGIGTPGTVDPDQGVLLYANNFKYGRNVPMRGLMQQYINKPVYLGNDANAAALGEVIAGAAKGVKNAVMVTLGTGVGGGIVIDGRVYEGQYSAAGEFGHIVLICGGEPCSCGRKGCWEAYASATALVRQTKEAMESHPESLMHRIVKEAGKVSGRTAFDAARQGDAAGQQVVDRYIFYIAEGLLDLINIFRPEVLIIGGGICNEGERLLNPLRAYLRANSYGEGLLPEQRLEVAKLGNDAGIIGAALMHA